MKEIEKKSWFAQVVANGVFDTPYMLTDLEVIRQQCREFKSLFPGVQLFYAIKCFSDDAVINAIDTLVDGYDVASIAEIEQLCRLDVQPSRMAYSNPVKSAEAIKQAAGLGVTRFAFQSENELDKIAAQAPAASVYVRVRMHDSLGALNFSSKFGCNPEQALALLHSAESKGLKPIGITFHVGSQAGDLSAWHQAIAKSQELTREALGEGLTLELINVGGGFPVQYSSADPTLEDVAASINPHLDTSLSVHFMAEPGRFLVADSSVIVTRVIGHEKRAGKTWLYLDTGAFQCFLEIFEFKTFPYPVYTKRQIEAGFPDLPTKRYALTGPSCDAYDTMTFDVELPEDIEVGDDIVVTMAGAYTIVYGSNFNGFDVPERHFINSQGVAA